MKLPNKVIIKQKVEMLEVITRIEGKNRYSVHDEQGRLLLYAVEQSNPFLRVLLNKARPLKVRVFDPNGNEVMIISRPMSWTTPKYNVICENNRIGRINWVLKWKEAYFEVIGNEEYKLPRTTHLWTYDILKGDNKVGQILKKWSGLTKELFTDADNFMIDFGTVKEKMLLVATGIAIDLTFFEN